MSSQGGGGGGGHRHQEATAYTDRPAAELEAAFADPLVAAGWTRVDGRAEDCVAWSAWRLPGDGDWRGLLLILGLFDAARRSLWLAIESAGADNGSGAYTTSHFA